MTNKEVSRTSEVQYEAASKLEKGCVRLFQTDLHFDVKAVAFGKWNRDDLDTYVERLGLSHEDLNEPAITDEGVLITAGKNNERVCLIDKDVFSNYQAIINA